MILDLCAQTLSHRMNNGEKHIISTYVAIGKDIKYCMAVYIGGKGDEIELIK